MNAGTSTVTTLVVWLRAKEQDFFVCISHVSSVYMHKPTLSVGFMMETTSFPAIPNQNDTGTVIIAIV